MSQQPLQVIATVPPSYLWRPGIIEPEKSMPERTHYETLGLPETASLEEIKKQYRSLARKYHPDVNASKQAAQQFSDIAEAYRVLNDTEARRAYDAERALRQRQANAKPTGPLNHSAGPRPAPKPTPQPVTTATQESERLLRQAQTAFTRGRVAEARSLAEQSLRYNRKNAAAWEVLGDVCRNQGRTDDALRHYTMASQHDPRSATVQQKIERIARQPSGGYSGSTGYTPATPTARSQASRATGRPSTRTAPIVTNLTEEKRPLARILAGFFGFFGTFLLLLFTGSYLDKSPQSTQILPFVSSWSWPFVFSLLAAGALLGSAMTITGMIRRIEDDLILTSNSGGAKSPPIGIVIVLVGLVFFWIAAALHLAIALIQESLTPSLLKLYGAIAFMTALFAICWSMPSTGGAGQTLLLGGNVIFAGFIIGWLLGDFFRPD